MAQHLSDEDMSRIESFAATPAYKRDPEQLVPEEETESEE
jgi:hypothetical protein